MGKAMKGFGCQEELALNPGSGMQPEGGYQTPPSPISLVLNKVGEGAVRAPGMASGACSIWPWRSLNGSTPFAKGSSKSSLRFKKEDCFKLAPSVSSEESEGNKGPVRCSAS